MPEHQPPTKPTTPRPAPVVVAFVRPAIDLLLSVCLSRGAEQMSDGHNNNMRAASKQQAERTTVWYYSDDDDVDAKELFCII